MTARDTQDAPLEGVTPYPPESAARYREAGYWRGRTLFGLLRARASEAPERLALVSGSERLRYGELVARVESLAASLRELGIAPRDRVVVQLPNVAAYYEVCFALFRLGAIPVMANAAHRALEIGSFLSQSGAVAYVIADRHAGFDYRQLARELRPSAPALQHVIVVGDAAELVDYASLHRESRRLPDDVREPSGSDVALFQLSGGSTGVPKLIPRTHDDYAYAVLIGNEACQVDVTSVYLVALPASHNFPLSSPGALGVLFAGGTVVLAPTPAPDEVFPLIARERVTITALVPPLLLLWLEAVQRRKVDLSSLKLVQVGGAKLGDEAARRTRPLLGCALQQVFGMAEGLVCYTRLDDPEELVLTTQGVPGSPADEVRVLDDDDCPVADGEVGHLLTRGPYTILGYYQAAEHNRRSFTEDGFYRTGDLVRRLPSGHLVVEGRAKDQINRGGEKVAAAEVEGVLLAHPSVLDVAIVAMPDPLLGERSCAFLLARGAAPKPSDLTRFLRERGLAAYKLPDRYEVVDQLPKTSVGKIDKKQLRLLIAQKLGRAATT